MRTWVFRWLTRNYAEKRAPDVLIGGAVNPYMRRWHVIPRNPVFNIYFHHFLRSDDDRALHDHPWWNISWLLDGSYDEITSRGSTRRSAGACKFRFAKDSHRIALLSDGGEQGSGNMESPVWTLFITGPKFRKWGFWCPKGWVRWETFTSVEKDGNGTIHSTHGRGCE
jgi:hypothetical protein